MLLERIIVNCLVWAACISHVCRCQPRHAEVFSFYWGGFIPAFTSNRVADFKYSNSIEMASLADVLSALLAM